MRMWASGCACYPNPSVVDGHDLPGVRRSSPHEAVLLLRTRDEDCGRAGQVPLLTRNCTSYLMERFSERRESAQARSRWIKPADI